MSLLYKKESRSFPSEVRNLAGIFKIKNSSLLLKGSSSLKVVKYFSDYDFLCYYKERDISSLYNELKRVIEKIMNDPNYYFIELKIQSKNGNKFRYNFNDDFNLDKFSNQMKNLNFFKIDVVIWVNNVFIDTSCLYQLSDTLNKISEDPDTTEKKIIDEVKNEIIELKKEKSYFKILKRYYFIFSFHPKTYNNQMIELLKYFNSDIGKLYQEKSELDATKRVLIHYDDTLTKQRAESFLKSLNIEPIHINNLDPIIQKYNNIINNESKNIINNYKIK